MSNRTAVRRSVEKFAVLELVGIGALSWGRAGLLLKTHFPYMGFT